jgi:hypothetical protein
LAKITIRGGWNRVNGTLENPTSVQASYVITLAPYFVLTALLAYGLQLEVSSKDFLFISKYLTQKDT